MKNVKINDEKINIKLYPIYKMFSWDLLFYYAIIFLFLTQVKGISASDVLLGESLYPLFKFIFQIPVTWFIDRFGKRKSLIVGNIFVALSILTFIFTLNFSFVVIAQFFSAIGYVLKGTAESNILYDSIPRGKKRGSLFSLIDGKATSYYYYLDGISAVISGFLYIVNGYLPMILCFIFCVFSTIIAFKFRETQDLSPLKRKSGSIFSQMQTSIKDIRFSFKYIFRSNRLRSIVLLSGIMSGFLTTLITLRSSLLKDLAFPEEYFGIIFAVLGIISGISAKNQARFHKKYRNKTLRKLCLPISVSCIIMGTLCMTTLPLSLLLSVVLIVFIIHYILKGPYYVLIKRYLNNFTTSSLRNKISAANNYMISLCTAIISYISSVLIGIVPTTYVIAILGCIVTAILVVLFDYMRSRVGLKPEQYPKKEIEITEVH